MKCDKCKHYCACIVGVFRKHLYYRGCIRKSKIPLVLRALSTHADWEIRSEVAKNPNTPADILVCLSTDEAGSVRIAVAEHPNTPVDTLIELSNNLFFLL